MSIGKIFILKVDTLLNMKYHDLGICIAVLFKSNIKEIQDEPRKSSAND